MDQGLVLEAFRAEAERLTREMTGLSEEEWRRPTRCTPWNVGDLLAHVRVAIGRLPGMLAEQEPVRAEVSAVGYYRPDGRFSPDSNTARVALAQEVAAQLPSGAALVEDFAVTWQRVDELCRAEPERRVVRTRHGDPMLLSEFLLTRVVELALHGVDLADGLGREPWLTAEAGDLVQALLLGREGTSRENPAAVNPAAVNTAAADAAVLEELGWGRLGFLRRATGRAPLSDEEAAEADRLGVRWLTLG